MAWDMSPGPFSFLRPYEHPYCPQFTVCRSGTNLTPHVYEFRFSRIVGVYDGRT
jgi:hypothetical protein